MLDELDVGTPAVGKSLIALNVALKILTIDQESLLDIKMPVSKL